MRDGSGLVGAGGALDTAYRFRRGRECDPRLTRCHPPARIIKAPRTAIRRQLRMGHDSGNGCGSNVQRELFRFLEAKLARVFSRC